MILNKEEYIQIWIDELEWNIAQFNQCSENVKIDINDICSQIQKR